MLKHYFLRPLSNETSTANKSRFHFELNTTLTYYAKVKTLNRQKRLTHRANGENLKGRENTDVFRQSFTTRRR